MNLYYVIMGAVGLVALVSMVVSRVLSSVIGDVDGPMSVMVIVSGAVLASAAVLTVAGLVLQTVWMVWG